LCAVEGCSKTQRLRYRVCLPKGCMQERACASDSLCCTEHQDMNCGTLLEEPLHATGLECTSRADFNSTFESMVGVKGECKDRLGVATHNCLVGERVLKDTCGVNGGGTQDFYACFPDPDCDPDCRAVYSDSEETSTACSLMSFDRPTMYVEVDTRVGIPGNDDPERQWAYFTKAEYPKGVHAYKLDTAFLKDASECQSSRYCERYCTNCTVPNAEQTACVQWSCQESVQPQGAVNRGGHLAYVLDPGGSDTAVFYMTGYVDDLDFIAACFDKDGNITEQKGNRILAPCVSGSANAMMESVRGKTYCYGERITNSVLWTARDQFARASCEGVAGYVEVWAPATVSGPPVTAPAGYVSGASETPAPAIGYEICSENIPL
ncbi:MAG: hypothetical protein V2A70_01905, partial [Candidatus Omnitrophota bacterium]